MNNDTLSAIKDFAEWGMILFGSGFIQFMINRHDQKAKLIKDLNDKIDKLEAKVTENEQLSRQNTEDIVNSQIQFRSLLDGIKQFFTSDIERRSAEDARRRILRFSDECRLGTKHSKEMFDNVLDDITFYNRYVSEHPKFVNEKTKAAEAFINAVYKKCNDDNDFL